MLKNIEITKKAVTALSVLSLVLALGIGVFLFKASGFYLLFVGLVGIGLILFTTVRNSLLLLGILFIIRFLPGLLIGVGGSSGLVALSSLILLLLLIRIYLFSSNLSPLINSRSKDLVLWFGLICTLEFIHFLLYPFTNPRTLTTNQWIWILVVQLAPTFLPFYVIIQAVNTQQKLRHVLAMLIVVALLESLLVLVQIAFPSVINVTNQIGVQSDGVYSDNRNYLGYLLPGVFETEVTLSGGTFNDHNALGPFLLLFVPLPFLFARIKSWSQSRRFVSWLVGVLLSLGLMLTFSRQSVIGVLVELLVLVMVSIGNRRYRIRGIVALLAIFASLFLMLNTSIFSKYYNNNYINLESRVHNWMTTLVLISSSPSTFLIGRGGSHYDGVFDPIVGFFPGPTNSYLEIWLLRGALGMALYGLFFFSTFRSLIRSHTASVSNLTRTVSLALLVGMSGFLASQLFDNKMTLPTPQKMIFFLLAGLAVSISRTTSRPVKSRQQKELVSCERN